MSRNFLFMGAALSFVLASTTPAHAATVTVDSFGDYGWKSDDTRNAACADLVGINNTNAAKPVLRLTLADSRAPFSGGRLIPGARQRLAAAAWDAGTTLALALVAFILIDAFWASLAGAMLCYYLGGILVLGNTPGVCLFAPRPGREVPEAQGRGEGGTGPREEVGYPFSRDAKRSAANTGGQAARATPIDDGRKTWQRHDRVRKSTSAGSNSASRASTANRG